MPVFTSKSNYDINDDEDPFAEVLRNKNPSEIETLQVIEANKSFTQKKFGLSELLGSARTKSL